MRLTNKIVEALSYEGRRTEKGWWPPHVVWDDLSGFGVRITPKNHKAFILRYYNQYGKRRYWTIGAFPELSASEARKEAERLREVIRHGGDPKEEAKQLRGTFTVEQLGKEYIAKHAQRVKRSWEQDADRLKRHVYSRWKTLAAPEVTRARVAQMHREIADGEGMSSAGGKVEANRALQLVSTLYAWAIAEGHLPPGTENPAKGIRKFPETPRRRWVRQHEMPWLLDALDQADSKFSRAAFWLILHTGARKSEALGLRWNDVDLTAKEVTFRETKNGDDHTVPLSTPIADILEQLPRVVGNPYVFAGHVEGRPLTNVQKTWRSARERAGKLAAAAKPEPVEIDLSDVTIHDLRRTVGAWLATAGYSELLIGRVLNHTAQSVTGIYARLSDEAVRQALEAHARQLENVRQPLSAKVVDLQQRRHEVGGQ